MNRTTFSKILLVQALEESDPHGRHVPLSTRHHATQQAREQLQPSSENSSEATLSFLTKRTDIIWAFVNKAFPRLSQSIHYLHIDIPTALVAIPALGAGLLMNGLGESQRVNVLNFPLLLLLLWNGGIYLTSALFPFVKTSVKTSWLDSAAMWLSQRARSWGQRSWPFRHGSDTATAPWMHDTTERFTALWWPHVQPVWTHRLRQLLHLGAVCVAVGIILSMYVRGLALEYQATWESTFLSANQVQGLLHTLLGPASWLLQVPFPDVSEIVSIQAPTYGPAAQWIHMWAVTTIAIIVVPRSIMMWVSYRSLNQARETLVLPLEHPYFVHLLAPDRGQEIQVDVMPYSYRPSSEAKNFLDRGFLDLFGNLATIQWQQPIPFGQEFSHAPNVAASIRNFVVIFNAGQTPEGEVQGEWLHSIQTQINQANAESTLLVLLDEEPYRQAIDDTRVTERRQAWQRLSTQYHLSLTPFDVRTTSLDQFLRQTQAKQWPASR